MYTHLGTQSILQYINLITELLKCDNITWQVMIRVLHHHNVPVLGVVDSSLTQEKLVQQHLLPSLAVTQRNVRLCGKIFPCPVRLPGAQFRVITIGADVLNIPFSRPMEGQACVSVVLG